MPINANFTLKYICTTIYGFCSYSQSYDPIYKDIAFN